MLLTVSDLDAGIGPGAAALRELFALSRAQVAVAVLLAEGREPRTIASMLAISLFTVRRHLADVMEKTDTHSQVQLVRLLMSLSDIDQPFRTGVPGSGFRT